MKRFLVGADRGQSTLLPECLDEWIDESNPVRAGSAGGPGTFVCATRGRSGPHQIVRGGQRGGQMAETVSLNEDGRRATITGRKRASLQQKMNPMWWFMNSAEQTVNEAPWYRPTKSARFRAWRIR